MITKPKTFGQFSSNPINDENYTWNPPKPKTVMVEHLLEDVEEFGKGYLKVSCSCCDRITEDCRKKLEELK